MFRPRVFAGLVTAGLVGAVLPLVPTSAAQAMTAAAAPAEAKAEVAAAKKPKSDFPGTPPMWVVHPFVQKKGKKAQIRAQVYVDPYRRPGANKVKDRHVKADTDKLHFRVTVAKKRYANPKKPRPVNILPSSALLADFDVTRKVSNRGIVNLKVTLGKKDSKKFLKRSLAQRQVSTNIRVSHWKDSFGPRKHTVKWGFKQLNDAVLQKRKASKQERKRYLNLAKSQVQADRKMINVVPAERKGAKLSWAGASPMYNYVYITNSTPFNQQIQLNPNIQCMWSGGPLNPPVAQDTVGPGGTIQTTYVLEPNAYVFGGYSDGAGGVWTGLNGATAGMNAPGTQVSATKDLVNAATGAGQNLISSVENGLSYNEEGAMAAVGGAVATFLIDALAGSSSGTCQDAATYPETFAVTSTVIGFGTDNDDQAWSADYTNYPPSTWNTTQPIPTPNDTQFWVNGDPTQDPGPTSVNECVGTNGTTANGQTCYWTGATVVGSQTSTTQLATCADPSTTPSTSAFCEFAYETMQSMLGAQTSATYYWNGGQPAYMVSNNAESPSPYAGGSAAFTGGLFQTVGPNPGLPGDAWCWSSDEADHVVTNCSYMNYGSNATNLQNYNPMGAMNVQLTYLSSPQFQSGLWSGGQPTATATATSDGGLQVSCDVSGTNVVLSTPFGPAGTSSINAANLVNNQTVLNAANSRPTNAQWAVNFYGLDSDGNFVYYNNNMGTATPVSNQQFELGPNAGQTAIDFNADSASQTYNATVYPADLQNMQTIADIEAGNNDVAQLAKVGCSVVPQVNLPGLDVTGTVSTVPGYFGQILSNNKGWPMPGNHTGWPTNLYSPYDQYTNYSWQWPVDQINVSFQGVTETASTSVNCTTSTCSNTKG